MYYSRKERKRERVFSLYVILYSIGRFFVEFLRNDERGTIGSLSTSQFISIVTLIIGILVYNEGRLFRRAMSEEVKAYRTDLEPEKETDMTVSEDEDGEKELTD